jgi:hypothetical protein
MKTQNPILSLVIILLLFFGACREVAVTTKVNPDGSFTRIITVTGDSADVFRTDLPFPVDETWVRTSLRDTCDSTKYTLTYSKSFKNSDELNAEIKNVTGKYRNMERDISITKRSRFFFSYLTFKEVYKSVNPFIMLDYRDYLTEEDIQLFSGNMIPVTATDSTRQREASDKVEDFLVASAMVEAESVMQNGIKKLNNPLLNPVDVSIYHDSLYKKIKDWDNLKKINLIDNYRKWSGNDAFSLLNDLKPPLFEDFVKKVSMLDTVFITEGYTEEVEMPGLITATNSAMLNGNQVRWEFQPLYVLVRDFEMYAESRVINYWAFILTGIVMLTLVILLVVKAIR